MNLGKTNSKKVLAVFEKRKKNEQVDEVVVIAADYWTDALANAGENQISYQLGKGMINLSEKDLIKFKKNFISFISKIFSQHRDIMLWTSDGKHFEKMGTDGYLAAIMKSSNLPLTCLPSDVCMRMTDEEIVIENNLEQEIIYTASKRVK